MVRGSQAEKPSTLVAADEPVALTASPRRFSSRGGEKLDAALDRFGVDVRGRRCLDAGASTGGFTDCLIRRGAAEVIAVDVGYGQLAWELRNDPRVVVLERTNVRDLAADALPFRPSFVAADLSFISLRLVLAPLADAAEGQAEFVLLIKPQFEAGREDVGSGGVVRVPAVWRRVIDEVADACRRVGLAPGAVMSSPLLGPAGNAEFPMHAVRGGESVELDVDGAIDAARELVR
jgi:23S rRNA (cytidine1920-2'-O)/16S rRNA (cytidine1409-2'-O)-methyltransferase